MDKVERIACYIRVSTQEQKLHGISLDAQRDALIRYAKEHNLKIVAWYEDEGISGRKLIRRRPALQRMLNDAKTGKFDRIIFIKLDRYFRSVGEYYECQKILDTHKVTWTATEERYDLTTASGRYWVTQKLAMAEYEADNTGERIKLVNEYKIKTGQPLTGAQCQGIGYTVKKDSEGIKRVVKDTDTMDMCMDIINYFVTHQSKAQTCRWIYEKYGQNYSVNSLTNFLSDTKIYGHYKGNDSYCEPYIDKATYEKIQEILNSSVKKTPSKRAYLFTGLITCPDCGKTLTSTVNQTGIVNYRCNTYSIYKRCSFNKRPSEKKTEARLLKNFDKFVNEYIEVSNIEDARVKDSHATEKITEVKGEITRVKKMYRKGDMTEAEYDNDMAELKAELAELESHLEPIMERDLTKYEELLKSDWKELYNALNRENKRAFWRKYIKEINLNLDGTFNRVKFF